MYLVGFIIRMLIKFGMLLTGVMEVLGEWNPTQVHFVHNKSHMDWPGFESGLPFLEAGD